MALVRKSLWTLSGLVAVWASLIGALLNPSFQRAVLYANAIHTAFWDKLDDGQYFGFMKNQIHPFNLTRSSGGSLYAWHVLPLSLYQENEVELRSEPQGSQTHYGSSLAVKLLKADAKSHVVISFHGNAGHLANGFRKENYRSVSSFTRAHVIAFDYSGFGKSDGHPSEAQLIQDGVDLVHFIVRDLGVSIERITLLAQSLGTAVASAVALHFADGDAACKLLPNAPSCTAERNLSTVPRKSYFAGVVLVAPFVNVATLIKTYRILGIFPILSPLGFYPSLQEWLVDHIADTWNTGGRLEALVHSYVSNRGQAGSGQSKLVLHILHAKNDADIPWRHSEALFLASARATTPNATSLEATMTQANLEGLIDAQDVDGTGKLTWNVAGRTLERSTDEASITLEIVPYGGHNKVTVSAAVALAVSRTITKLES